MWYAVCGVRVGRKYFDVILNIYKIVTFRCICQYHTTQRLAMSEISGAVYGIDNPEMLLIFLLFQSGGGCFPPRGDILLPWIGENKRK